MTATTDKTEALILTGDGYGLTISPEAEAQKALILKHAALIVTVNDPAGDAAADIQLKLLAAMRIGVEKSRVEVKKPALQFGADVDAKAKAFGLELNAEEKRLKDLRGAYATAVLEARNKALREIEAKRQEEARRLADAEALRVKQEREAEALRIAAEQAAWEASTPAQEAAAKAEQERLAKLEADRLAAEQAEAARIAALPVAAPAFVPEAPKGVKMIADFDVVDVDALYRHEIALVDLTPRRADILDYIKRNTVGETLPTIPGLRVFLKPQVR